MSSRNTSSANTTARVNTPYCKVCYDAGRPEKEYTSHYVKDQPGPNGKVICPTLLNQACRICHNNGHTSSYCPQYSQRRQEPRREERYIEREPRREERYIEREPRREERYIEREPRREERYIEREPRREERYYNEREPRREERYYNERPRREERYIEREPRRVSFNDLREDTERRDREISERDEIYHREQERLSKPWLQAALKPAQENQRGRPYAHPHGPRVRLSLEENALCASKHATNVDETKQKHNYQASTGVIDVRKVELNHSEKWGDEDNEPFIYNPEQMTIAFLQDCIMANLTTSEEHDFIASCDDQSEMPFECGN